MPIAVVVTLNPKLNQCQSKRKRSFMKCMNILYSELYRVQGLQWKAIICGSDHYNLVKPGCTDICTHTSHIVSIVNDTKPLESFPSQDIELPLEFGIENHGHIEKMEQTVSDIENRIFRFSLASADRHLLIEV